jgi:CubicO group peptidase (beta-lactamase class C family)
VVEGARLESEYAPKAYPGFESLPLRHIWTLPQPAHSRSLWPMRWMILLMTVLTAACAGPGARVRVAFDAARVTSISATGLADRATKRRVTADDPVRVASVSKLVVALGVMRLVDAGKLDLDRDVSDDLGWRLRNPAYPETPVTLRLLLSHTAGVRDGNDYRVPLGKTVQTALSDAKAWDAGHVPGRYFTYSNLNFPIIGSIMERATGERFDVLMQRLVLKPLGVEACYNWPTCSDARVARAVVLYHADGSVRNDDLHGKQPPCPVFTDSPGCDVTGYKPGDNGALFSPQGGLRISARDLGKIGQMLLGDGTGFLSPAAMAELTKPVWTYDGSNGDTESGFYCRYALALQTLGTRQAGCRDDPYGDGRPRIGHAGEAYGLRSGLWIDPVRGTGVAFFATAIPDEAPKGKRSAFTRVEEELATGKR